MKLTKEQAIIITGYTGIMACNFTDFHEDVEKRLGYPVMSHEFGFANMRERIRDCYKEDFIAMCYAGEDNAN